MFSSHPGCKSTEGKTLVLDSAVLLPWEDNLEALRPFFLIIGGSINTRLGKSGKESKEGLKNDNKDVVKMK